MTSNNSYSKKRHNFIPVEKGLPYKMKLRKKNGKTEKGDRQFNSWFNPSGVSVLSFIIQKFSLLRRIDRFSP